MNFFIFLRIVFLFLLLSCQQDDLLQVSKTEADLSKQLSADISILQQGKAANFYHQGPITIRAKFNQKPEYRPHIAINRVGFQILPITAMDGSGTDFWYTLDLAPATIDEKDAALSVFDRDCSSYSFVNSLTQKQSHFECQATIRDGLAELSMTIRSQANGLLYFHQKKEFHIDTSPLIEPKDGAAGIDPYLSHIDISFREKMDQTIFPTFISGIVFPDNTFRTIYIAAHDMTWLNDSQLRIISIPHRLIMLPENLTLGWLLGEAQTADGRILFPIFRSFSTRTDNFAFANTSGINLGDRFTSKMIPSQKETQIPAIQTNDWIVVDNSTGLIWEKCLNGSQPSEDGGQCQGEPKLMGLDEAASHCANLNDANSGQGYGQLNKWRIPGIRELASLADFSSQDPFDTMRHLVFPNSVVTKYWSNTFYEPDHSLMWTFNFVLGLTELKEVLNRKGPVRCVFSDQAIGGQRSYTALQSHYVLYQDNITGLLWDMGETSSGSFVGARQACNNTDSFHTFEPESLLRLPTVLELINISVFSQYDSRLPLLTNRQTYWSGIELGGGYLPTKSSSNLHYTYSSDKGIFFQEQNPGTSAKALCVVTRPNSATSGQ